MDLSGESLLLAPDINSQEDASIKRGIYYGLLVKGWDGGDALSPAEEAVAAKLEPVKGSRIRDGVSLSCSQAEAALAALKRNQEFLRRSGYFGSDDMVAWQAIPEIEAFVTRQDGVASS